MKTVENQAKKEEEKKKSEKDEIRYVALREKAAEIEAMGPARRAEALGELAEADMVIILEHMPPALRNSAIAAACAAAHEP